MGGTGEHRAAGGFTIRPARDRDADSLIDLIGAVFSEYPGCVLDVDGEVPELRAIATAFEKRAGRFWVAEREARVLGCVGVSPPVHHGSAELHKLYVSNRARRAGLGTELCRLVESEARRQGARFLELWSDTRFRDAHRLYERLGYVRLEGTRELHDLSRTLELHYQKPL